MDKYIDTEMDGRMDGQIDTEKVEPNYRYFAPPGLSYETPDVTFTPNIKPLFPKLCLPQLVMLGPRSQLSVRPYRVPHTV